MDETDLCYLPGHEALALFRSRELSPVDLVNAQQRRFESVGATVNAFTDQYFDEALCQARQSEQRYSNAALAKGPLEGLTVAIKDNHDIAGKRTTHASLAYKNNVAERTHPACQRLLDAGAILVAKTTTPEFCTAGVTDSRLFGATGTPWNPAYTAGGSSGGSAAALAAGLTTLATGSDIAGSIRVPAACCGITGYKPPYGRVPSTPPINLDPYCQSGPLARSAADCALMTNVMAGQHTSDIASLAEVVNIPIEVTTIADTKIAVATDLGFAELSSHVRQGLTDATTLLASLGAEIEQIDLDFGANINEAGAAHLDHLVGYSLQEEHRLHGELLCDYNIYYAEQAAQSTREKFINSQQAATRLYERLAPILDAFDVLICPTVATHEVSSTARPWETVTINDSTVDADFGWVMTLPFNMVGRLPVIAVPVGIGSNGLPTGIQIVARAYDDERVFKIARTMECASPRFDCTEHRPPHPVS